MNGVIKNNKVHCPFCNMNDYRVGQPRQVAEGTQITGICNKCDREFEYIVRIVVGEDNKRFIGGNEDE